MNSFFPLFKLGLKRRSKDFFVLFYSIVFPTIVILLLGYLTSTSYGTVFTSYYYYTLVTVPFCALMGISTVSYAAQDEKLMHTSYRFIVAPITKTELILSKFGSCFIVLSLCNVVTLGLAKFLFDMDFYGSFLAVILLLTSESAAVTGIGLYLGLACKNLDSVRNYINLPIVIFGFLGGAFFPVSTLNPVLSTIINISPLTWVTRGLVKGIYEKHFQVLWTMSIIFVMIAFIATYLTIKRFKKEAFI